MFPTLILSFAATAPMLDEVVKITLRDDIPLLQIVREARKTELNVDKMVAGLISETEDLINFLKAKKNPRDAKLIKSLEDDLEVFKSMTKKEIALRIPQKSEFMFPILILTLTVTLTSTEAVAGQNRMATMR